MKAYGFLLSVGICAAVFAPGVQAGDWVDFNGNRMAQKYAAETQITPQNVKNLSVAWSLNTGDVYRGPDGRPAAGPYQVPGRGAIAGKTSWQSTPLFANNTVYVSTPFYRIFAVRPDTGKVKWIYDAFPQHPSKFHGRIAVCPIGPRPIRCRASHARGWSISAPSMACCMAWMPIPASAAKVSAITAS